MKITRSQLSRIINEEIASVKSRGHLKEGPNRFVTDRAGFQTAEYNAEISGNRLSAACVAFVKRLGVDEPGITLEMAIGTLLGEVEGYSEMMQSGELKVPGFPIY